MDKKIHTFAKRQTEFKRKQDDNQQQQNKRQNTGRAYTAGSGEKKLYGGSKPQCAKCNYHHDGPCAPKCHKAKQTRERFPLSEHKTSVVGDIIHLVLWGPYKVTSRLPSSVLNVKKSYKLYSLDDKTIFYSRDVRFYENVFPFKMNSKPSYDSVLELSKQDLIDQVNFFDSFDIQTSKVPMMRGELHPMMKVVPPHTPNSPRTINRNDVGLNIHIFDVNIENTDEVQPAIATRKSSRQSKLPARFNDYVVNNSKKYGLEKVMKYSHLSSGNYWFSTSLIKYVEPRTFYEAVKDRNWVDAMNAEIEALNRNYGN
ncbi:hypothetical protein Tco_1226908 [Tanacetum coccineum]